MRVLQYMATNHQMSHQEPNKDELPWDIQGLHVSKRLSQPCTNHAEGQDVTCINNTHDFVSILHLYKQNCNKTEL